MLTGVHFILTYICNYECDHCFLYCSPSTIGTFTSNQVKAVLDELKNIKTGEVVYFEGGEPFLFHPLLLECITYANDSGYRTGVVTNTYWATSEQDAELWLRPLQEAGLSILEVSDDTFHNRDESVSTLEHATAAARNLG
ncbi:radical SAM protein, partial [Candidatus Neomarinimicrobiota bacterium]